MVLQMNLSSISVNAPGKMEMKNLSTVKNLLTLWTRGSTGYNFRAKNVVKGKIKRSQLAAFYLKALVYCYLEFKLRYLKNLKLFSIIWAYSFMKKRWRVFAFKSIVLREGSLSNTRWFYGKKTLNWVGKCVFNWKLIK